MRYRNSHVRVAGPCLIAFIALLAGCGERPGKTTGQDASHRVSGDQTQPLSDWPRVESAIGSDPAVEVRIREIVAGMTLAQKIGQMTQAEIKSISPEQVRRHYIGSVLNGGGSWPGNDKRAAVRDWLALADRYYDASMSTDMVVKIPIVWGTDAVHGHSNVYGATIYPHNIGLGAARDAALVARIAAATGRAVRATGIDWLFAPAVPVVQDIRWGRSYESWSEDPDLVREYANAYVRGLQGSFADDANAIATVKHFIGDGGTEHGADQGVTRVTLPDLINMHGAGYFGAIAAGAQTVMASYNSWTDAGNGTEHGKMHGIHALLTDALKRKIGFDGFVVSDWNAIGQLPGCSNAGCARAINAGIDMVMVPDEWKAFIENTTKHVENGEIPISRIDDAVSRILRVKLRAGLFDGRKPSRNIHAGKPEAIQNRVLARQAVRQSLVLLKNNASTLPLVQGRRVLVVGKSADSMSNQTGGWSLTWQGTDNGNADFPNGDTVLDGIREALGDVNVGYSERAKGVDLAAFDAIIAVIGETPYAETTGDIVPSAPVSHSSRHPEDLAVLQAVSGKGKPVVTVFLSGRPLYVNDLLNLSDAFVAAWLPGTEGKGVSDLLFAGKEGKPAHDFRGVLPFSWPGVPCPGPRARGPGNAPPLFAVGYGLSYATPREIAPLRTPMPTAGCGKATTLPIFNFRTAAPFALHVAGNDRRHPLGEDLDTAMEWPQDKPLLRVRTVQISTPQDAKEVTWLGPASFLARGSGGTNLNPMRMADGALQFDAVLKTAPKSAVLVAMECGDGCMGQVDLTRTFLGFERGRRYTVTIPLDCFAGRGANLGGVEVPFRITADRPFAAAFTAIRIVAGAAAQDGALACGIPD